MNFVVFRCRKDPDYFIITDEDHAAGVPSGACPSGGDLEKIGVFAEQAERRVAFNETIAKNSIAQNGFYRIEAKTFDPVAQPPGTMPG
jgi:hypothetical protein